MTCEICIMNRHAAVLAADSASTVTRWADGNFETRYFKGANKIFQLSHHHPVGVMIFNSADLMQVPWEILIKGFRNQLANKSFNTLQGYADEFFSFIDGNTSYFPQNVQNEDMQQAAQRAALGLVVGVVPALDQLNDPVNIQKVRDKIAEQNAIVGAASLPRRISPEQEARTIAEHSEAVENGLSFMKLPDDARNSLAELSIRMAVKKPSEIFPTAGLVFAGFGDHEIFPQMIEYQSSGMISGTLALEQRKQHAVDHNLPATMEAFAQTSMSDTFSLGFSQDVYVALMDSLRGKLDELATAICTELKVDPAPNLDHVISAASKGISDTWFERARREHSYPLWRVLGDLPVQEMAELAETLVNLQSLKEKVTKPSTSVGGPVDVAIITKHEGLVWVKRKLYFDSEKNLRYVLRQQAIYR